MQCRSFILATLCTVTAVLPAWAHHSHATFDISKWRVLDGTVKQMHWIFPHAGMYLEVEDEQGQIQIWVLGGANPNAIQETGVSEDHVLPGDRIRVRCRPLLDGTTSECLLGFVTPMHGDMARGHGVERAWN